MAGFTRASNEGARSRQHARSWRVAAHGDQAPAADADLPLVPVIPSSAKAGESALEALVDAAAGILSADSLPGTLGRIAHHLATLVPHDDLSLYEIEEGGKSLKPVFAVGDWVDEIMSEEISVQSGVTGWVVRNRRTRNVPNTLHEPLCTVVTGTEEVAEAFVAVPLIAHDRVVGSLNVYRTGEDVRFTDAVGRLGGEEFVIVLPGVDTAAAGEAAERARVAISEVQIGGRQ